MTNMIITNTDGIVNRIIEDQYMYMFDVVTIESVSLSVSETQRSIRERVISNI